VQNPQLQLGVLPGLFTQSLQLGSFARGSKLSSSSVMNNSNETFFAAVGDVHGHHHEMVRLVTERESQAGERIAFVLQVGDFEPHRDEADLESMAAPAKYRVVGDFPDFYSGECRFPWPVYFIGGNHEPYGFLDTQAPGEPVAHNCVYLGRAGATEILGIKVAGLSGIFNVDKFSDRHPKVSELKTRKKKDYTYFNKDDVDRIVEKGRADVLMVHEWPTNIVAEADRWQFEQQRRSMRYDSVGNEYARILIDLLSPRLVLCGHMHKRYRNQILLESGAPVDVCCLANVQQGTDSVALFCIGEDSAIAEIPV
jgi:lariat debranching enzyme